MVYPDPYHGATLLIDRPGRTPYPGYHHPVPLAARPAGTVPSCCQEQVEGSPGFIRKQRPTQNTDLCKKNTTFVTPEMDPSEMTVLAVFSKKTRVLVGKFVKMTKWPFLTKIPKITTFTTFSGNYHFLMVFTVFGGVRFPNVFSVKPGI